MHSLSIHYQDVKLLSTKQVLTTLHTKQIGQSVHRLAVRRQFFRDLVLFFPPLPLLFLSTGASSPRNKEDGGEDFCGMRTRGFLLR